MNNRINRINRNSRNNLFGRKSNEKIRPMRTILTSQLNINFVYFTIAIYLLWGITIYIALSYLLIIYSLSFASVVQKYLKVKWFFYF